MKNTHHNNIIINIIVVDVCRLGMVLTFAWCVSYKKYEQCSD